MKFHPIKPLFSNTYILVAIFVACVMLSRPVLACENLITVDTNVDGLLLTENEKTKLLEDRYYEALAAYSDCLLGIQSNTSISSSGTTTRRGIRGTEAPSPSSSEGESASVNGISGSESISGLDDQLPNSNGKVPDDIPPADNDDALALQLRSAAENETDPEMQNKLWNEYRRYKGIPFRNTPNVENSPNTVKTQPQSPHSSTANQFNVDQLDLSVATVWVSNYQEVGVGSGFIIAPGKLITNEHVVVGAYEVWLEFGDGEQVKGIVQRVDRQRDVALVRFNSSTRRPVLSVRQGSVKRGDKVYSFGSPRGLSGTLTNGIVSAIRPGYIQSNVAISPGNSGGPLLDENYSVVGIAVLKDVEKGSEGLSFFIPIKEGMRALGM